MCTVSFIPLAGSVYITHNRDERAARLKALPPGVYNINDHQLLFPRDGEAGGSWVAINQNGNAAVLLNGGFINHINQGPYRKSRGIVFLELVASTSILHSWQGINLNGIEAFNLIVWDANRLFRCVWDGNNKHQTQMNETIPHTWSSATLYDFDIQEKRKSWFEKWLQAHPNPAAEDIIAYHLNAGDGDTNNDLKMNRAGQLLTVSLTAITIASDKGTLKYIDLLDNSHFEHTLPFIKAPVLTQ